MSEYDFPCTKSWMPGPQSIKQTPDGKTGKVWPSLLPTSSFTEGLGSQERTGAMFSQKGESRWGIPVPFPQKCGLKTNRKSKKQVFKILFQLH